MSVSIPSRMVQSAVHPLHPAAAHLLLPASDLLSRHSDGHALLGLLLDRPPGRSRQGAAGYETLHFHIFTKLKETHFSFIQTSGKYLNLKPFRLKLDWLFGRLKSEICFCKNWAETNFRG